MALFFLQSLTDLFEFLGPVVRFLPDILTDVNGGLGLGGEDDAIAGAGIDFDDLGMDLVLGLEDDAGEVGITTEGVDDDALDLDIEGVENVADQLVGERAFVVFALHGHGDGAADAGLDVDDEAFFVVTDKNGQRMLVGGKDSKHLHAYHIRVHTLPVALRGADDNAGTDPDRFLIL